MQDEFTAFKKRQMHWGQSTTSVLQVHPSWVVAKEHMEEPPDHVSYFSLRMLFNIN